MANRAESRFFNWQLVLGCLHYAAAFGLAGYAEIEGKDWTTYVYYNYNAWVAGKETNMPSGDGSVIYSIEERVSDDKVSLIWASAAFSIISGTHHFFAFFFQGWYKINCIVSGVNVARWVDYGLFFLFFFDLLKQIAKKLIFHN